MAAKDNINKDHEKEENLRALEEKVKGNPSAPQKNKHPKSKIPKTA
jgi:hypothetical protein